MPNITKKQLMEIKELKKALEIQMNRRSEEPENDPLKEEKELLKRMESKYEQLKEEQNIEKKKKVLDEKIKKIEKEKSFLYQVLKEFRLLK